MPPPKEAIKRSFAHVYDALYGRDASFLEVQMAFLRKIFGPCRRRLLDLGCGTGIHLVALSEMGHAVVGVDLDPLMLQAARRKALDAGLVLGDLRRLPFRADLDGDGFDGALCLESPLAYLLDDTDLASALKSIRSTLSTEGKLVIDIYDYVASLGTRRIALQEAHFESDAMRVMVRESHDYAKKSRIWTMRQQFEVEDANADSAFEVVHRLRMRTLDEYAQALEGVGFTILEVLTEYPHTPESLRHERRLILVAGH